MDKEKRRMDTTIPDVLIIEIFSKLPVKSLCRFKCVSKFCLSFIEDSFFVEKILVKTPLKWQFQGEECIDIYSIDSNGIATHTHSYKFENDTKCYKHRDGLICYLDGDFGFCIYNLTTMEGILLPEWCEDFELSFDPSSKKYKILGWKASPGANILDFKILTLEKSLSWRPVANTLEIRSLRDADIAVDGKLFWAKKRRIISFDHANEEFQEIDLPDELIENNSYAYSLFEFEGSLTLVEQRKYEERLISLWMLKVVDRGDIWNMMKMNFTIPFDFEGTYLNDFYSGNLKWTLCDSHFSSRGGEILIAISADMDNYLFFYNPLNGQFRLMTITELNYFSFRVRNYVENYLYLEALI